MDKYELLKKIGQGTYGKVFKGTVKATGQAVALKKTHTDLMEGGVPPSSLREIANLKMLSRCKNIVKLLAVETEEYEEGKISLYLVFEYMECDLLDFYNKCSSYDTPVPILIIKNMMYQLLNGIEYSHRHGVIHRDLKPQNLLLDIEAGVLKVADFGLGRVLRKKYKAYTQEVITLWYRPPELLLGAKKYNFAIDIWSIGCILAELCLMRPFFKGETEISQIFKIFEILGTPNEEVWPGVSKLTHWSAEFPKFRPKNLADEIPSLDESGLDLLSKMLQHDPSKRISARDALSHSFFFEIKAGQS